MIASYRGYLEIVEKLVQNGADINQQQNDGDSAFNYACRYKYEKVIQFLNDHFKLLSSMPNINQNSLNLHQLKNQLKYRLYFNVLFYLQSLVQYINHSFLN